MNTRNQKFAQEAFAQVNLVAEPDKEKFKSFSKSFPTLIHNCGLAQAVAFAQAKKPAYIKSLLAVLSPQNFDDVRTVKLAPYQKLTRDALAAATWLQRYAEILLEDKVVDVNVSMPG